MKEDNDFDSKIENLIEDREAFNKFVYTPLDKALIELQKRQTLDFNLSNLPKILENSLSGVLFRHIATTNYEIMRFIDITEKLEIKPIILEYTHDIFLSMNKWKHSLGKLTFYKGTEKDGKIKTENQSVFDFNFYNRKSLKEIETLWEQNLVNFHHELFLKKYPNYQDNVFDLSDWLKENGGCSNGYYKRFLSLFVKNAILFENFLLKGEEKEFTKNIILPAIIKIQEETGLKPLIVALEPTKAEDDLFWLCHPVEEKLFVKEKLKSKKNAH